MRLTAPVATAAATGARAVATGAVAPVAVAAAGFLWIHITSNPAAGIQFLAYILGAIPAGRGRAEQDVAGRGRAGRYRPVLLTLG